VSRLFQQVQAAIADVDVHDRARSARTHALPGDGDLAILKRTALHAFGGLPLCLRWNLVQEVIPDGRGYR
jgi:hypothetical protein